MVIDGTYNITVDTPLGKQTAKLILNTNGNILSGSIEAEIGGLNEFSGSTVNGNEVTWNMVLNSPIGQINVECKGTIVGDEISGEVKAGDFGTMSFKGKRAQ
jgi:hypothetical protein